MVSLVTSVLHLKNVELISVDFGYKVSLRFMKSLDLQSKIERSIYMFKWWIKLEKESLVFNFTIQNQRNGDKLILKGLLFMQCIFTRTNRLTFLNLRLIKRRIHSSFIWTKMRFWLKVEDWLKKSSQRFKSINQQLTLAQLENFIMNILQLLKNS